MEELSFLLGDEVACQLMAHFGGLKIYIPQKPEETHILFPLLGVAQLGVLCRALGGTYVEIPRNQARLRQMQRQRIHQLRSEKMTQAQIAHKVGCTERWVRQVLKQYPLAGADEITRKYPLHQ